MIFNTKSEAEKNFETFIPNYQIKLLEDSNDCNFGLFFQRICHWQKDGEIIQKDTGIEQYFLYENGEPIYDKNGKQKKEKSSVRDDCITYLFKKGEFLLKESETLLEGIHKKQGDYLNSFSDSKEKGEIKAKLVSPFITGLGAGHPTETGMILDRNTGVPYIPASTIKGVLRTAYAVSIADENGIAIVDDAELDKIFGGENNSSKIVFLDAYPEKIPTIQSDIMNPHFNKYYNGENKVPLENEKPVPIKFLSVKPGCNFVFRYIIKDNSITETDVDSWFQTAFEKIGFGGKTAIGYGRFKTEKNFM